MYALSEFKQAKNRKFKAQRYTVGSQETQFLAGVGRTHNKAQKKAKQSLAVKHRFAANAYGLIMTQPIDCFLEGLDYARALPLHPTKGKAFGI